MNSKRKASVSVALTFYFEEKNSMQIDKWIQKDE